MVWLCFLAGLSMQLWLHANAQDCLQGAGSTATQIPFSDLGPDVSRLPTGSQAIVTSYQFHCCGEILEWGARMQPGGPKHRDGVYTVHFQVWRPSPTSSGGSGDGNCYSLVGENRFPGVTLGDDRLLSETPQPTNVISVRPGDVLGYFVSSTDDNDNQGIQLDPDFTNDVVYYADFDAPITMGTALVGPGGVLSLSTSIAPVVSVSMSSSSCPTFPPPIMMTSSSTQPAPQPSPTPTPPPQTTPPAPETQPPIAPTDPPTIEPTTPDPPKAPDESSSEQPTSNIIIAPSSTTTDQPTTDEPPTVLTRENPVNTGLIAGLIVVVLVLIVATVVVAFLFLLRRNAKTKRVKMGAAGSKGFKDLLNPSYDYVEDSPGKNPKPRRTTVEKLDTVQSPDHYSTVYSEYAYPTVTSKFGEGGAENHYYTSADATGAKKLPPKLPKGGVAAKGAASEGKGFSRHYSMESSSASPELYEYLGPEYGDPDAMEHEVESIYSDPVVGRIEETEVTGQVVPSQRDRKVAASTLQKEIESYSKLKFFEESQIYWAPGFTTSEIYDQLSSKNYREISRKQITTLEHLGSGQFGVVTKGVWNVAGESITIAIKQLLSSASGMERVKLLQEAAIMGQFSHPNVVTLYGLVTVGDPLMVCIEFMKNGDLRNFIENIDLSKDVIDGNKDIRYFFLRASKEIAAGMKYLSRKSFIHRDLAARNILLNDSLTCKVGDFGMARDLMDDTYYTSQGGSKIPVKWTAPEALLYKKYSPDSDVWSYAMLLFEMWTLGKKPFPSMSNHSIMRIIESGYCQPPPPGCPRAIYRMMVDCWNPQHQYRPNFGAICNYLEQPASKLLYWSPNDSILSPQVEELGAPLENSAKLYPELQDKYKKRLL